MKKIALIATVGLLAVACTKWENKSTEFKVTGLWTGVNQELQVQALPFLDTNDVTATPYTEANFMENGGLVESWSDLELRFKGVHDYESQIRDLGDNDTFASFDFFNGSLCA